MNRNAESLRSRRDGRVLIFPIIRVRIEKTRKGMKCMEVYYYRCPVCGFIYQVPAYWVSYSPDPETDFPHLSLVTGQMCENAKLILTEEQA